MVCSYRFVTDPSMPNGTGGGPPIPFTRKGAAGQAMRSRTIGVAEKAVPAGAMSWESASAARA